MLWLTWLLVAVSTFGVSLRLQKTPRALALLGAALAAAGCVVNVGMYELRKLAGVLLMPVGLLWVVATAVMVYAFIRRPRPRQRWLMIASVLWLACSAAGNPWLSRQLMSWWEGRFSRIDPMQVEPLDAVLVLGGGIDRHDWGQTFLGSSGDRVVLGARLFLAGRCERLISSGPPWPPPDYDTSVPELSADLWRELGIAEEQIILLEGPRTTSEEIAALAELMARQPWQRVGLVSSACHLRRAMGLAARHGLELIPLPADFRSTSIPLRPQDLVPQGQAFADLSTICWEMLGIAAGR